MKKLYADDLLNINGGGKNRYETDDFTNIGRAIIDMIRGIKDGWNGK